MQRTVTPSGKPYIGSNPIPSTISHSFHICLFYKSSLVNIFDIKYQKYANTHKDMKNLNIEALQKLSLEQLRQGKLSKSLKTIDRAIKMDKKGLLVIS